MIVVFFFFFFYDCCWSKECAEVKEFPKSIVKEVINKLEKLNGYSLGPLNMGESTETQATWENVPRPIKWPRHLIDRQYGPYGNK